jgi:hypothetical protein
MITLVNFADKRFKSKQKWNSFSAKCFGGIDKVLEYNPNDIEPEILQKNKESVKYKNKGFGNYFWKPYIIKKALSKVNDGEYLFYADSGSFFIKNIKPLIHHLKNNNKKILCFSLPLIEKQWTKRDAFILMDCDEERYSETTQRMATFLLLQKSKESIDFVEKYVKYCSDSRILSDDKNVLGKENHSEFIEHRHDQSVLSLLSKNSNHVFVAGDISDYGYFPYNYIEGENRLFDADYLDISKNMFKGMVLSNRNRNPIIYLLKYSIKRFFLLLKIKI